MNLNSNTNKTTNIQNKTSTLPSLMQIHVPPPNNFVLKQPSPPIQLPKTLPSLQNRLQIKPTVPVKVSNKKSSNTSPPPSILTQTNGRNALQNRLKINVHDVNGGSGDHNSITTTPSPPPQIQNSNISKPVKFESKIMIPENMTPIEELEFLCKTKRIVKPDYKVFQIKLTKKFQCKVTVNGSAYSTYPIEFRTEYEAQSEAARIALDSVKTITIKKKFDTCLESTFNIGLKIFELIKDSPNGVFTKTIPEQFQDLYNQSLPENWFDIIFTFSELFSIDQGANNCFIVFANLSGGSGTSIPTQTGLNFEDNFKTFFCRFTIGSVRFR